MLKGVDISAYQGRSIDWPHAFADGIAFAYIKSSEGAGGADPTFAVHRDGAHAAGMLVGAYHFAHPTGDARAQAHHFHEACAGLGALPDELPPALDLETMSEQPAAAVVAWAAAFLDECQGLFGCLPVLYSYPAFLYALKDLSALAGYPLWLASYDHPARWPTDDERPSHGVPPWTEATIWQVGGGNPSPYSLPGAGPVDCDVWLGDMAGLVAFAASSRV